MVTSRLVVPSAARAVSRGHVRRRRREEWRRRRAKRERRLDSPDPHGRRKRVLRIAASARRRARARRDPATVRCRPLPTTRASTRCPARTARVRICGRSAVYAGEAQASTPNTSVAAAIASPAGRERQRAAESLPDERDGGRCDHQRRDGQECRIHPDGRGHRQPAKERHHEAQQDPRVAGPQRDGRDEHDRGREGHPGRRSTAQDHENSGQQQRPREQVGRHRRRAIKKDGQRRPNRQRHPPHGRRRALRLPTRGHAPADPVHRPAREPPGGDRAAGKTNAATRTRD